MRAKIKQSFLTVFIFGDTNSTIPESIDDTDEGNLSVFSEGDSVKIITTVEDSSFKCGTGYVVMNDDNEVAIIDGSFLEFE